MAEANLTETLMCYTLRANRLDLEIAQYQNLKTLAAYSQADANAIKAQDIEEVRRFYKDLYDSDPDLRELYRNYTEIEDFETEIDKIEALYQDQLAELNAWETQLDAQITTASAEKEEINAYKEFMKTTLSSNIQEDYNFKLS